MTKLIRISSIVAAVLLLAGTFFKVNHYPGANVLLMVASAAGILLFVSFISSLPAKLSGGYEKFSIIFSSVAIIIAFLAFLFKLNHYPGAAKLIWAADIGILLSAIILLVDGVLEKNHAKMGMKFIASFFAFFLLLIIYLMT